MSESLPSLHPAPRLIVLAAAAGGMLLAGAVALWAYFGSAVFYEMIVAGLAACF